jgi:hypothetical protein
MLYEPNEANRFENIELMIAFAQGLHTNPKPVFTTLHDSRSYIAILCDIDNDRMRYCFVEFNEQFHWEGRFTFDEIVSAWINDLGPKLFIVDFDHTEKVVDMWVDYPYDVPYVNYEDAILYDMTTICK